MSRVVIGLAASVLMVTAAGQAHAADWGATAGPVFKPAYPADMEPAEDSLDFEAGMRYFYGVGSQSFNLGGDTYSADDTSHSLEVHARIDDHSTSTYLKAHAGYGAITDGTYEENGNQNGTFQSGRVSYGVVDFGYAPLDTGTFQAGFFGGYQYANESPLDTGIDVHGLRLGVSGRAEIADAIDFNFEAAAIPYAYVAGAMSNPDADMTGINGSMYGGSAEAMLGFHATDTFTIRGGVRGTYLAGMVASDQAAEEYIEAYRWGPLVELTARF